MKRLIFIDLKKKLHKSPLTRRLLTTTFLLHALFVTKNLNIVYRL